jgi:hypothetical protein
MVVSLTFRWVQQDVLEHEGSRKQARTSGDKGHTAQHPLFLGGGPDQGRLQH